jgi:hypothetical protein
MSKKPSPTPLTPTKKLILTGWTLLVVLITFMLFRGAGGISEGMPEAFAGMVLPKFRAGGLLVVHAGGHAGLFSAIIGGWLGGAAGSEPVTVAIGEGA